MVSVADISGEMQQIAPLELAEDWDNVGLLVGDPKLEVQRIMTCLTISDATVREAIAEQANLVISHHPIPFRPIQRIVATEPTGKHLWDLISAGIAIYSPHTAWDNAPCGINQQLAEQLELMHIEPITKNPRLVGDLSGLGTGRMGSFLHPQSLEDLFTLFKTKLPSVRPRYAGDARQPIHKLGIVCGSGASMMDQVAKRGCDAMLTGEATYHDCLKAENLGMRLLLIGHHASERFAMDRLAAMLSTRFPSLQIWGSRQEVDPVIAIKESN